MVRGGGEKGREGEGGQRGEREEEGTKGESHSGRPEALAHAGGGVGHERTPRPTEVNFLIVVIFTLWI